MSLKLEILEYMEHMTDHFALSAKGDLVKVLHKKVNEVKTDQRMEEEIEEIVNQ